MKLCEIKELADNSKFFTVPPWAQTFKSFIQSDKELNSVFKKFCIDIKLTGDEYRELMNLAVDNQCYTGELSKHMIVRGINGNQWKHCMLCEVKSKIAVTDDSYRVLVPIDKSFILKLNRNFYNFTQTVASDWNIYGTTGAYVADHVNDKFYNLNTYALGARFRKRDEVDKQHSFNGADLSGYLLYI